jgi:hypothetical protein
LIVSCGATLPSIGISFEFRQLEHLILIVTMRATLHVRRL